MNAGEIIEEFKKAKPLLDLIWIAKTRVSQKDLGVSTKRQKGTKDVTE